MKLLGNYPKWVSIRGVSLRFPTITDLGGPMNDFSPPDPWAYPNDQLRDHALKNDNSLHFMLVNNASKTPDVFDIYWWSNGWIGFEEVADAILNLPVKTGPMFGHEAAVAEKDILWYTIRRLKQMMLVNVDGKWGDFEWTAVD